MKTLQLLFSTAAFVLLALSAQAQEVPRRVVVEHFTNSRCGICANRNPGFYTNLNSQEGVLHISYHPSSPYSSCVLHQANASENDGRTNYYDIYGSTPKLVIQGELVPVSTNYGNASIFDNHINQTSPVEITLRQAKADGNIQIEVDITAAVNNTLGEQPLFLGIAEDIVFYDAPNGEDEHYDVFRRTLTGDAEGVMVNVPATQGETLTLSYSLQPNSDWDFERLFLVAILQDAEDRSVIQSHATTPDQDNITNTREPLTLAARVFPNPVQEQVEIRLETSENALFVLSNAQGQVLRQGQFAQQTTVDVSALPSGIYQLEIVSAGERSVQQLVKE